MKIGRIHEDQLYGLLELYQELHDNILPEISESISDLWNRMLSDRGHHIIAAVEDGKIISSCVLVVVPNLTHSQRPYGFIENVITRKDYRKKGLATACLNYAKEIAQENNCYKIMLMTGSKEEDTLSFYRKAGYNSEDKTAFIQWL